MKSDSKTMNTLCYQEGQALTELIFVIPVLFIFIQGVSATHAALLAKLSEQNSQLNHISGVTRVPEWLRPHWRRYGVPMKTDSNTTLLSYGLSLPIRSCFPDLQSSIQNALSSQSLESEVVFRKLDRLRLMSLSVIRTACIAEGSARVGPANATLIVLGLNNFPNQQVRRNSSFGICPIVARSTEGLRSTAVLMGTLQTQPLPIKTLKSRQVICIR